jgi:hypothetical protein
MGCGQQEVVNPYPELRRKKSLWNKCKMQAKSPFIVLQINDTKFGNVGR